MGWGFCHNGIDDSKVTHTQARSTTSREAHQEYADFSVMPCPHRARYVCEKQRKKWKQLSPRRVSTHGAAA